jgi:tetratricopeptide (TPR) repeat protein
MASDSTRSRWIARFLLVLVALVYSGVAGNAFVAYDDDRYVYANPTVTSGLSVDGIAQAFTEQTSGAWYPATTISHMISWEVFGDHPTGHHLVNLALHAANAVLLYVLFCRLTGAIWLAAIIATLFAIHPLHVESVAWVTERKDVLSGFFGLLALLAYVRYANRPSFSRYASVLVLFSLALLAKSMLVTLPCLFLLLDYWPLGRARPMRGSRGSAESPGSAPARSVRQLLLEKVPLLALSLLFCIVTFRVQLHSPTAANPTAIPLLWRLLHAPISYLTYLGQGIWPSGLACFYPHPALVGPESLNEYALQAAVACAVLAAVTWFAAAKRNDRPWLLVGWLWYLGMLVPVLGIVQVGFAARADRFVYLPFIGIYLLIAASGLELARRLPTLRRPLVVAALGIAAVLAGVSWRQVEVWNDSETLFRHALAVTERNAVAHSNLGVLLFEKGDTAGAVRELGAAIAIDESIPQYHHNLGFALQTRGDLEQAVAAYQRALATAPNDFDSNYQLANALFQLEDFERAIEHYRRALEIRPNHPKARHFLQQAQQRRRQQP